MGFFSSIGAAFSRAASVVTGRKRPKHAAPPPRRQNARSSAPPPSKRRTPPGKVPRPATARHSTSDGRHLGLVAGQRRDIDRPHPSFADLPHIERMPPKFTDVGRNVAGHDEQAHGIAQPIKAAGAALDGVFPGAGQAAARLADAIGDVLASGNAAGISRQQLTYVNGSQADQAVLANPNSTSAQLITAISGREERLDEVERVDGSKLIYTGSGSTVPLAPGAALIASDDYTRAGGNSGRYDYDAD